MLVCLVFFHLWYETIRKYKKILKVVWIVVCVSIYTHSTCRCSRHTGAWNFTPIQAAILLHFLMFSGLQVVRAIFAFIISLHHKNTANRMGEMCLCTPGAHWTFMGCLPDAHIHHDQLDLLCTSWREQSWCRKCKSSCSLSLQTELAM